MQRYEYRVVSVPPGQYTSMLNQYGAEGWELQTVAHDVRTVPARRERGLPVPVPGLGKLGEAAQAVSRFGETDDGAETPEPGSVTTTLLWVLRRPLGD